MTATHATGILEGHTPPIPQPYRDRWRVGVRLDLGAARLTGCVQGGQVDRRAGASVELTLKLASERGVVVSSEVDVTELPSTPSPSSSSQRSMVMRTPGSSSSRTMEVASFCGGPWRLFGCGDGSSSLSSITSIAPQGLPRIRLSSYPTIIGTNSADYTMYPVALGSTHACMYVHMYTVHIDKTILCMPDPSDPCPNYSREAG